MPRSSLQIIKDDKLEPDEIAETQRKKITKNKQQSDYFVTVNIAERRKTFAHGLIESPISDETPKKRLSGINELNLGSQRGHQLPSVVNQ